MKVRMLVAALLGALAAAGLGAWTATSTGAVPGDNTASASLYVLSVDGVEIATFAELNGISSGYAPQELGLFQRRDVREIKVPDRRTPPTVTLTRGLSASMDISAWHELAMSGDPFAAARNVTLVAYDSTGKPMARWHLEAAWPAKLEIGALKAGASEVLMETVTMTCEFIQRVAV